MKRSRGKSWKPPKVIYPIYFACNKLGYIKWNCPLLKDKTDIEEKKKEKWISQHALWDNSNSNSFEEETTKETTNLCLMAKERSSHIYKD